MVPMASGWRRGKACAATAVNSPASPRTISRLSRMARPSSSKNPMSLHRAAPHIHQFPTQFMRPVIWK